MKPAKKQIDCVEAIAGFLDIELPDEYTEKAYSEFIDEYKEKFIDELTDFVQDVLGVLSAISWMENKWK